MKLYLLRHGIAVDQIGGAIQNDSQRPLTKEGIVELERVGLSLKRLGVKAELVVSSPLVRARQTAEIIHAALGSPRNTLISESLSPGGTASDLYKVLRQFVQLNEIFLVGHEPGMSRLAGTLLWCGPDFDITFKKAGICRIDINDVPPTSAGTLKWFLTPKIMSAIAGR